ncbi:MAG: hypothetical protein QXS54_00310 [Candidatus Methanomethylicaceae archaeon]
MSWSTEYDLRRALRNGDEERIYGKRIYTQYGWIPEEETPTTELEKILYLLNRALLTAPNPALIYAGRYVITNFDRDVVPDWVRVLAGGNPDNFEAVVDETLRWKEAENAGDDDGF